MTTTTAERVDVQSILTPPPSFPAPSVRVNSGVSLLDTSAMEAMYRIAETMASGRATVPRHLQGNSADCLAIVMQAQRWGMDPFVVAKKTYVVDGNLSYEAQLVAAVINTSSLLNGRLHYEWFGPWEKIVGRFKMIESKKKQDDNGYPKKYMVPDWSLADEQGLGVIVRGLLRGENEPRELQILMTQARTRNSTLWAEDPKQQIAYLTTNRWARLYAPELILGVYTPDEFAQSTTFMGAADVVDSEPQAPEKLKADAHAAADKGRDAFAGWWKGLLAAQRSLLVNELESLQQRCTEADTARTVENGAPAPAAAPVAASAAATSAAEAPAKPARARAPAPKPPPPEPDSAQAPGPGPAAAKGAPVFTAETVRKRLNDAPDLDALFIAADLIHHVSDPAAAGELDALFEERKAALEP